MDDFRVAIRRCEDYDEARVAESVARLLSQIEASDRIRSGMRVLLKPNFLMRQRAESASLTHPAVIKAVAEWVSGRGATPFIGDSPAFGSARGVAAGLGLGPWLAETGIEVITLRQPRHFRYKLGDETFHLTASAEALDADAIINLPKVKAHQQMRITLGVKNLYGCVTGKRKPIRHTASRGDLEWFARMILANWQALTPVLTLADGIQAMERTGPRGGDVRDLGLLFAGTDDLALDRVIVDALRVEPVRIPLLAQAKALGFRQVDLHNVEILGEPLDSVRVDHFELPGALTPIDFSLPHLARSFWKSLKAAVVPGR